MGCRGRGRDRDAGRNWPWCKKMLRGGGREGICSEGAWCDSTNWLYLDIGAPPFPPLFSCEYKKSQK